ncbi:PEP-CTERM sorting domain-containing protein [Motiliproteus sediminis]|uniref:PEP-CTERM sorting domain-containing protein n=1 Tax=Motiliproteus sediminis TaxID=1468178 RepID=UPI001AF01EFB|nr:PEP-CTERM sorting domain-containing protein [Motiliproteus sediminis]
MKQLLTRCIGALLLVMASTGWSAEVLVTGDATLSNTYTRVNAFYDGLAGHSSSIINTEVTAGDLAGIELFWAVQPANDYTNSELTAMAGFLAGGGRIAFMGEHGSGFGEAENIRINSALSFLGSAMSIVNSQIQDSGGQTALRANGEILDHDLTAGVDSYNYAAFAPILGAPEVLMLGHNLTSVMMGFENIGAGSIFLITDQNVFDAGRLDAGDNQQMFENLLLADTGAPPPPGTTDVPLPATLWLMGLGLAVLYRRRQH